MAKLKTIPGHRWHPTEKYWTTPHTDVALTHLFTLFIGEPVEVEPSLRPVRVLANRKPPHEPEILQAVATMPKLLDQVRRAICIRRYSYRTEEAYAWECCFTVRGFA